MIEPSLTEYTCLISGCSLFWRGDLSTINCWWLSSIAAEDSLFGAYDMSTVVRDSWCHEMSGYRGHYDNRIDNSWTVTVVTGECSFEAFRLPNSRTNILFCVDGGTDRSFFALCFGDASCSWVEVDVTAASLRRLTDSLLTNGMDRCLISS